jgi:hypothetical protein
VSDYWDDGKRFVPKREGRGTGNYEFFELSLAQGPVAIGVTGDNELVDFIGTAWLLILDLDMQLRLFRRGVALDEWEEITTLLPPVFDAPLPVGARRVSFCFDQSARIAVAYELAAEVFVTQWNPVTLEYVQRGPYAGVDPVLMFDAVWAYDITVSDVVLFYLTTDRERVECRVQRDNFADARPLYDYAQPVVLDRVVRLGWKYQVLVSDAAGDPRELGGGLAALRSLLYPVNVTDEFAFSSSFSGGEYLLSMLTPDAEESPMAFGVTPGAWEYRPSVLDAAVEESPFGFEAIIGTAEYLLSLLDGTGIPDEFGFAATIGEAQYVFSLISQSEVETTTLGFAVSIGEGSYELG